jgi:CHAD domain-containing protein
MTTLHTEREAKFEGTGIFDPQGLQHLPGVARLREEPAEELDALYFDTADLRLLAHGVTLRRREGGHDAGWHAKLPASDGSRTEVHSPPSPGPSDRVPAELSPWLKPYARGRELIPVVHMHTRRRRHVLLDEQERPLAEVAQDSVSAQVLGAERLWPAAAPYKGHPPSGAAARTSAGTSTRLTSWSEIEVELVDGSPKLLDKAARGLRKMGWQPSPSARKLDHALADALPSVAHPEPSARREQPPEGSAGHAVMARLDEQAGILLRLDPAVRGDEPDAVHSMRTTARRIRNLLRSHRKVLDRARTDPVAAELGWLTSVLAGPRDHEVLGHHLRQQARRLDGPRGAGDGHDAPLRRATAGLADLVAEQERERHDRAWQDAVDALDGPRYFALLDALDALRYDPPLLPRARKPAVAELRRAARRDHRRLRNRMAAAAATPEGPERELALHSARKAARRVRHAAETAMPYCGKRAKRLRKHTKAVQQLLGDHQDAMVARTVLPDLAADAHRRGRNTFGYGLLHAHQESLAREARKQLPDVWSRARHRRLTRFG